VFDAIYVDNPLNTVKDLGIYLSDQISYDSWRITLGARYDKVDNEDGTFDQEDSELSLSAGVLCKLDNGASPYISYSESLETFVGLTADGRAPNPQQGKQMEVGVKYEPVGFPGYFSLSFFDIEISNLPDPNSLQNALVQLPGESNLTGFEFEGKFTAGEFDVKMAYSTLDAEYPNGG
jgi:iron complex outermembrane receptor protein